MSRVPKWIWFSQNSKSIRLASRPKIKINKTSPFFAWQIAPKEEEAKELQAYQGAKKELAPPEQFLLAMSTVPRLTDKLNILVLMQQFEARFC